MSRRTGTRVPESTLTSGLARVYQYGTVGVATLLLIGLLHPLTGWEPARLIMTVGVAVLLALPVVTSIWVGFRAALQRDRHLVLIVLGILGLLVVARLLPLLLP
ncbi:hypothetical protein ACFL6R_04330 [Gemmatimonadota bacterium]